LRGPVVRSDGIAELDLEKPPSPSFSSLPSRLAVATVRRMELHLFLESRADLIVNRAVDVMSERSLPSYMRLGREDAFRKLRQLFDVVVEGARTRHLDSVVEHAERIGNERYESGFEFVEVQSAMNLLEESIWTSMLSDYPPGEVGSALGIIATLLGAAKDRLACTYLTRATSTHVGSLDMQSLFKGTQNTGLGEAS
jgi:hypothetical protein